MSSDRVSKTVLWLSVLALAVFDVWILGVLFGWWKLPGLVR